MPEDILENFKRNLRRKVHIQPVPHLFCKRLLAVCQAGRIEVAEPFQFKEQILFQFLIRKTGGDDFRSIRINHLLIQRTGDHRFDEIAQIGRELKLGNLFLPAELKHPMNGFTKRFLVRVLPNVQADLPKITCQCIRVPVLNGHTAAVFINFAKKPTKEELIEKLVNYRGYPQEENLPSAPKQFIRYLGEENRPQVALDVEYENGMGISIGRLREDSIYDYKFVGLSHNTVRGAAGGAVLCAEALTAKGYIKAKIPQ